MKTIISRIILGLAALFSLSTIVSAQVSRSFSDELVFHQPRNQEVKKQVATPRVNSALSEVVDVTVTGRVTDSNGEPIPGVTVSVLGTTTGTATDLDGKYTLSVPEGSTLVFSFIGYESQQREVGDQSIINVTLAEDMASLDEVVVVGYGTQQKSHLTGSVGSMQMDQELMSRPADASRKFPGWTWFPL